VETKVWLVGGDIEEIVSSNLNLIKSGYKGE
jgi:hypothetical protein